MNHKLENFLNEEILDFMSDNSSEAGELDKFCFISKFENVNLDDTLEDEFHLEEGTPDDKGKRL